MSIRHRAQLSLGTAWELALDFLYPPRCGGCDRRGTLLCDSCRGQIAPPHEAALQLPGLDGLLCAGIHKEPLRAAIHKLKYESDTPLAKALAKLIVETASTHDLWREWSACPPVLVPVPLHRERQRMRGFNQAELIARELARVTGWQMNKETMRVRDTPSQVGLSAKQRRENVREAFSWAGQTAPERVLLVDDVCTTGATLLECTLTLRSAGAEKVYAVTVAKAADRGPDSGS